MKKQKHTSQLRNPKLKAGVFIDGANLYYSQKQNHWKIDLSKLKKLLVKEVDVDTFNYYQAIPYKKDSAYLPTKKYIAKIEKVARIRTKPLKYIKSGNRVIKKGDVDVEIVLDVVRNLTGLI